VILSHRFTGELADALQSHGVVMLPEMSREHVSEMLAFLRTCPRYACHVERDRQPYAGGDVACWSMDDVLAAPNFFEFALSWAGVAWDYLGCTPRMYSVNAFETFPADTRLNPDIQEFHTDKDDDKFLALFVYLTDVTTPEDGAHEYQMGTHAGLESRGLAQICGSAGTAFLSDGKGRHRGLRPQHGSRVIAWARWGISDPPASYLWDHMKPSSRAVLGDRYPTDPVLQDQIKLVVQ